MSTLRACENSGTYVPTLSPPFIKVMIATLNTLLNPAKRDPSSSSFSTCKNGIRDKALHTPSRVGKKPMNPMGSVGRRYEKPKPMRVMVTMNVNPMYWPRTILNGVKVLLVVDSEKNVTKNKHVVDVSNGKWCACDPDWFSEALNGHDCCGARRAVENSGRWQLIAKISKCVAAVWTMYYVMQIFSVPEWLESSKCYLGFDVSTLELFLLYFDAVN